MQQLHKGKKKVLEESLDDEEKRDFDLMEDDEPEQPHIHHGFEIVDLEVQDEAINESITIREKDAQIQALMGNLARDKYVISYLEQENKQLSDKQVLMELELVKAKKQSDKGKSVMQEEETPTTLTTKQRIEKEVEEDRETWLDRVNLHFGEAATKGQQGQKNLAIFDTNFGSMRSATSAALFLGASNEGMVNIFGFIMMSTCTLSIC